MNFLAVDTSGNHLAVVACKDGEIVFGKIENCAMKHSTSLMGVIDETLKRADLSSADCEFFAAAVGAGSFTGIRIGISVAKGFALAHGKKTLPITSFDTIAYTRIDKKQLCVIDALHGSYYVCGYENGQVTYAPAYLTEEEVLALATDGYALRAGSAVPLSAKADVEIVDVAEGLKNAVLDKAQKGEFGELTALYVRKSSAEINLEGAK
jgi:tRNA threonylcarbamoyladenosine biosynthesis protein TsaB